jgi:phospholipid/cholesterol/gamma-HCH transport system ATP-binding protein
LENSVVEFRNFEKSFGSKRVHRGVSFQVHKGECLGLIGGSGAGKSVILRSLIGLEKPDRGEILVDNREISHLSEDDLISVRKKIAYVFQGGALFDSMTVFENLSYPLREHTSFNRREIELKVLTQLEELGLSGNEKLFPANLSGGMQKRVGLARAIIMQPEVVLYDEPTAGLDPFNTIRIQEMILTLKKKGKTGIIVTHDMPTAFAVCDRIALLKDGKISAIGTRKELEAQADAPIRKFIDGEDQ